MINLHVLFADADPLVRDIIAGVLQNDPFFVARGCCSGDEALKIAVEWPPDLALLDAGISTIDGRGVPARLRADRRTASTSIVFMIGPMESHARARLRALGAAGIIEKPLDPGDLAAALRRSLPIEGVLAAAREDFLRRLDADACALTACRTRLLRAAGRGVLTRISRIAHGLAGAGGIYGFAGITSESATLWDAAEARLAGRAHRKDVERALDRLLRRISPNGLPRHAIGAAELQG
jgi:CheY-like chemotaxis protein